MVSGEDREREREIVRKWKLWTTPEYLSRESTRHDICTFCDIALSYFKVHRFSVFPYYWCVIVINIILWSAQFRVHAQFEMWSLIVWDLFDDVFMDRFDFRGLFTCISAVLLCAMKLLASLTTVMNWRVSIFIYNSEWRFTTLLYISYLSAKVLCWGTLFCKGGYKLHTNIHIVSFIMIIWEIVRVYSDKLRNVFIL